MKPGQSIVVDNLTKHYRIGEIGVTSLRESLGRLFSKSGCAEDQEVMHTALDDISFSVEEGEIVGVIGVNGAGKSTLLKILSRVTAPTHGRAMIRGRSASLLEVGTGFHPELSGRDNVFLNGSLLGMSREEIKSNFDDIVFFAGLEKFIDTPVKRYSSGMYVRLAFSVAAYLRSDVMFIDEVLAVGDIKFREQCLQKMQDVTRDGRTILFVSHNLSSISSITNRCLLLNQGKVIADGVTHEVIRTYLNEFRNSQADLKVRDRTDRKGTGLVKITNISVNNTNADDDANLVYFAKRPIHFNIELHAREDLILSRLVIAVKNASRDTVLWLDTSNLVGEVPVKNGVSHCHYRLPSEVGMSPGRYYVNVLVESLDAVHDHIADAMSFEVIASDFYSSGKIPEEQSGLHAAFTFSPPM
jgi:lipopolysaccharide transport system ATP-binding protein